MTTVTTIESPDQLELVDANEAVGPISPATFVTEAPDAHWILSEHGRLTARCSGWWRSAPPWPGQRVGLIGHYAASNAEAGRRLIDRAWARLRTEGCTMAVGPMDGNTWRRYRFITERGSEPPFFLEPDNHDRWPLDFTAEGFQPLSTYHSAVTGNLSADAEVDERLDRLGVTFRTLDVERIDEELLRLHTMSEASFQENFLYTPIAWEDFRQQYRALLPHVRPELVTFAEFHGEPIGFLFAIPDLLETAPGRTVILKSMAVVPSWRRARVASVLFGRTHSIAGQLGYRRAIHALMHDTNVSRTMSRTFARPLRRYTLFGRTL